MLPIFRTKILRDYLDIKEPWDGYNRDLFRRNCFYKGDNNERLKNGKEYFQPICYRMHDDGVPIDWAHILISIYQIRCDLFHGGKNYYNSGDIKFVKHAFNILWKVWGKEQLRKK